MLTPEEKAKQLTTTHSVVMDFPGVHFADARNRAKQAAIITVLELLEHAQSEVQKSYWSEVNTILQR